MANRIVKTRPSDRAFTLIELLVVISIIAILIGLLLPALSAARDLAVVAQCLANQHQMGVCLTAYEGDNNGALPGIQALSGGSPRVNGELGVQYGQPPYCVGGYGSSTEWEAQYYGWKSGAMIYATFEKSTGTGNTFASLYPYGATELDIVAPYASRYDGITGWDLAQTDTTGDTAVGSKVYTAPCGLGYIGSYLSPYGTMDSVDGRTFYCPGTPASFSEPGYMTDPFYYGLEYGLATYFIPRNNQGVGGLYSTFLSDWNKGVGQGGGTAAAAPGGHSPYGPTYDENPYQTTSVNPYVYSTYIYRSGDYYDRADANGIVYSDKSYGGGIGTEGGAIAPGSSVWHNMDTKYPTADAPFLTSECFVVCNSLYCETTLNGALARESALEDICHIGKTVNRAFHDGSAASFTIPPGHLSPADSDFDGYWQYYSVVAPPGTADTEDVWTEGLAVIATQGYADMANYGPHTWPYYWAILDGKASFPPNAQ